MLRHIFLCLALAIAPMTFGGDIEVEPSVFRGVIDAREAHCLAVTIWKESRGEPSEGKMAVGHVVMNRVNDARYPNTVCDVVVQKQRGVCQFSWVCSLVTPSMHGVLRTRVPKQYYDKAVHLLTLDIMGHREQHDVTGGALFFRNKMLGVPRGAKAKRIGDHVFW